MQFSEKLIQLRKDKGWTQAIAARNINIQQSYLSKLENGRFIPSEEVIDKLCLAYDISPKDLNLSKPAQHLGGKIWVVGLLLGLAVIITAHFGLLYPQTYYTYKVTPLGEVDTSETGLSYHLSDQYNGEKYVTTFSSIQYEYELIAERVILRKENRWLFIMGIIITFFALAYPITKRFLRLQSSKDNS